jgi:hypothetical protein
MRSRRAILIIAGIMLVAAAPALAQVAGVWAGEGKGNCFPHPGTEIHPWQNWKGVIPNSMDIFKGKWHDADGNYGIFKGKPVPSIPEIAVFRGSWYWYDPLGSSDKPVYGGDFEMIFHFMDSERYWCEGTWMTIWPSISAQGTMKGRKIK